MTKTITESIVEDAALAWLKPLGYTTLQGPDIAVGELAAERTDPTFRDVILEGRLRQALARPLPSETLEDAYRKRIRNDAPTLLEGYAVLRDTLLPKFISGQIRVADAERMVDSCEPNAGILRCEGIPLKPRYIPADKR